MPIGKPLPNVEVFALNDVGNEIMPGEVGELYIGGVQLFAGYCNDIQKTESVIVNKILEKKGRFYKTGDYVTIDSEGNYIFKGRKDDMIKIAGQLIYLKEIEKVLLSYNKIIDSFVYHIDDELFNSKIIAFIVSQSTDAILESELINYLTNKLPKYMIPAKFHFLNAEEIPKSSTGKIDRQSLIDLAKQIIN